MVSASNRWAINLNTCRAQLTHPGWRLIHVSSSAFLADDAPAAALPTGQIIFAADAGPIRSTFAPPTRLFIYDPELSIISQLSTPFDVISTPFPHLRRGCLCFQPGKSCTETCAPAKCGCLPVMAQHPVDCGPKWMTWFSDPMGRTPSP